MITYQIWKDDYSFYDYEDEAKFGMLYNKKDIKEGVNLDGDYFYTTNLTSGDCDHSFLTQQFEEFQELYNDEEDDDIADMDTLELLELFFEFLAIDTEVRPGIDYEEVCDMIIYDVEAMEFANLNEYDAVKYVKYLDSNSNWREHVADGYNVTISEIIVDSATKKCLDEWDGRNKVTGGVGEHQYIYKVATIDDEEVDDMWMVQKSSQWQGVRDMAAIMKKDELINYLEEIGRDPIEYI